MSDYGKFRAELLGTTMAEQLTPAQVADKLEAWLDAHVGPVPAQLHIEIALLRQAPDWEAADKAVKANLGRAA